MKLSINWLKKFTDVTVPIEELVQLIGARLVEVEGVEDLGKKYIGVRVARVVSVKAHPDSDHMHIVLLDDGGKVDGVERNSKGHVQVVCGAPNVRKGLRVAWLPPKCIIPDTYGTEKPIELGARKLRGVESYGMIASARELDLYDDHEGILEIDKSVEPGTPLAEVYELNDYILDIENKSLTHRPDVFGVVGFAREVAAIQGLDFHTPAWLLDTEGEVEPKGGRNTSLALSVSVEAPELCARYRAVVVGSVEEGKPSPIEIQTYLARVGVRPIGAVVDITNYLMILTGQPLHAFDYDKLVRIAGKNPHIVVRAGRDGESLELLDGRTIQLSVDDIVIAAGGTAVALAGAMGGKSTAIDENSKNIVIEAATFNLYNLRATQMRHGLFSEAITRFTKGVPEQLSAPVLAGAARLLDHWAGASTVSQAIESYPTPSGPVTLGVSLTAINKTLGTMLSLDEVAGILRRTESIVQPLEEVMHVQVPYWRTDIHIPEDIIEEVGRLYGFDNIAPTLPSRAIGAVRPSDYDQLRTRMRGVLSAAGANEVLTYSFVHGDLLIKAGQNLEDSYRIVNSISPDLQYYRQSLTPSLLNLIHPNIKAGYEALAIFELNKAHNKVHGLDGDSVPAELDIVSCVVARKKPESGAAYYAARKYLDYLSSRLGMMLEYSPMPEDPGYPITSVFEHKRSALVSDKYSGTFLGIIGEYRQSVKAAFKLPDFVAGFEIDQRGILKAVSEKGPHYESVGRYPGTDRDMCFEVPYDTPYATIAASITEALAGHAVRWDMAPVDIFAGSTKTKRITVRLSLNFADHTITKEEAAKIVAAVAVQVKRDCNSVLV